MEPTTTQPQGVARIRFVRSSHVPEIGGCPAECGHTNEQHAAFDVGVYDGEHGTTIPPVECCEDTDQSRALREAWMTGYSVGVKNRPNVKGMAVGRDGSPPAEKSL